MTRKDYIKFAEVLRLALQSQEEGSAGWTAVRLLITDIADVLYRDNARFDYGRFETACGLDKAESW